MRRALAASLIVVVAFAVGVSVGRLTAPRTNAAPGKASYPGLSELGATQGQWKAQHEADPRSASRFLPPNRDGSDRFINVTFDGGRVSGFIMRFDAETMDETAAKMVMRGELPGDANLVFDSRKYLATLDIDEQCDLLQFRSTTIETLLSHDRGGVVSVVLWSPGPLGDLRAYDPAGITSINVLAAGTLGEIPDEC
jgi:hypothetical protein